MKRLLCIAMALALCLSLVSVGAVAEGKVSLKFATNWGPGDAKYDYFEPLYNAYVDSVKDSADIQIETLSTVDYKTKIKVEMPTSFQSTTEISTHTPHAGRDCDIWCRVSHHPQDGVPTPFFQHHKHENPRFFAHFTP